MGVAERCFSMNELKFDPALNLPLLLRYNKKTVTSFLEEKNVSSYFFFGFARDALHEGLRAIGFGSQDCSVLVPSYICNAILPPLRELGLRIVFYDTLLNLEPNIDDLERKIDETTKAILFVNYFGFPSKMKELKEIADKRNLLIVEDNAHSFLSENNCELLGSRGDIGISSFRKTFPVPNGAVLYVKEHLMNKIDHASICSKTSNTKIIETYRRFLFLLISNYDITNRSLDIGKRMSNLMSSNQNSEFNGFISPLSLKIINNSDFDKIANRRRKNFLLYIRKLEVGGLEPIFEKLDSGVVPWVFPALAKNPNKVRDTLARLKIPTSTWPDLPIDIREATNFQKF